MEQNYVTVTVLTATGFANGRGQFLTHRESTPLDRSPKNLFLVITSATRMAVPNLGANPSTGGFLAHGWNVTKIFIYLFIPFLFHELTYRSDPSTDFHAWWLKRRGLAQGCAFWGFRWYCSPFCKQNPQTPIFGARIGVFKQNGQNIESFFMLSRLLHRF